MTNLALQWLARHNRCVGDIDCVELAGEVIEANGSDGGRLAFIEPANRDAGLGPAFCLPHRIWNHHAVAVVDGLVHDPWCTDPAPIDEWLAEAFPGQRVVVEYPAEAASKESST